MSPPKINFGFAILLLLVGPVARPAIPVFQDGKVYLPILVASDAPAEEKTAAQELARVLGKMSGLDWPVRAADQTSQGFRIGAAAMRARTANPLKPARDLLAPKVGEIGADGFHIWTEGGEVLVVGATPAATEFAVSWWLQRAAGVRWYTPGADGEVIPRRSAWSLDEINVVEQPAYVSREIYGADVGEGTEWARHNGLRRRLVFTHALNQVFSPQVMQAHAEWAPWWEGHTYIPTTGEDHNWQPNLLARGAAEFAAQQAAAVLARSPTSASVSLGMNDSVRFDQSAATRAVVEPLRYFRGRPDYSPLLFTFMNRAAQALPATLTEGYLGCLAYFWCENPPPFAVSPRVVPYVTTDHAQYYDRAYRAEDLALMSRWGKSGARAFGLWDYAEGGGFLIPRVPLTALAEAMEEGWRRGARGYFAEAEPNWGFDACKVWMLAQLAWNPKRSVHELSEDFYRGYYGKAAPAMSRFFQRCEELWMAQTGSPYWLKFYRQEDQARLFPSPVCRELRASLEIARQLATAEPFAAEHVAQTSRAFAVTEAYVDFDEARRMIAEWGKDAATTLPPTATMADEIDRLLRAREHLEEVWAEGRRGKFPAIAGDDLAGYVRNDPVPRLLWLAGQQDPRAALQLLRAAGRDALAYLPWRVMAAAIGVEQVKPVSNIAVNGSFRGAVLSSHEPRFLFPGVDSVPAGWQLDAMPCEASRVALEGMEADGSRRLRITGAWDTQLFQWVRAQPGQVYVAKARLRGRSSWGNDSALFLTFRSSAGQIVGPHRMQSLPKGSTPTWWQAALAEVAPAEASWVGVGVGASRQVPGDWLEINRIELHGFNLSPPS